MSASTALYFAFAKTRGFRGEVKVKVRRVAKAI